MNLYQFYQEAALRSLGEKSFTDDLVSRLKNEVEKLSTAFYESNKVDYSCPLRRAAYMLCYAPKHAVCWREIAKSREYRGSMMLALNSYGTGPASEVIGYLEGLSWTKIDKPDGGFEEEGAYVDCKEAEEGWRDVLEIVSEMYQEKTGRKIVFTSSNETRLLRPLSTTLGSFVLSDLARQGQLEEELKKLRSMCSPSLALFLDTTHYKKGSISRAIPEEFDRILVQIRRGLHEACNAEMDGCRPLYCAKQRRDDPRLNLFAFPLT